MYNTILVPIDLAHAERGKPMIEVARRLASEDGTVVLLNVVEAIPAFVEAELPTGTIEKHVEEAQSSLSAMATAANLKAKAEVRAGSAPTAILETAQEIGADLIIVASHKPGLSDYLLGSTAARVVRHAKCSVLVSR